MTTIRMTVVAITIALSPIWIPHAAGGMSTEAPFAADVTSRPRPLLVQQQGQTSYKYYCSIESPPDVAQNWIAQGRGQQALMFDTAQGSVYFLGGVAQYKASGNFVVWTYVDNFSQQQRTASFDTSTKALQMENGTWTCNYTGPGP